MTLSAVVNDKRHCLSDQDYVASCCREFERKGLLVLDDFLTVPAWKAFDSRLNWLATKRIFANSFTRFT